MLSQAVCLMLGIVFRYKAGGLKLMKEHNEYQAEEIQHVAKCLEMGMYTEEEASARIKEIHEYPVGHYNINAWRTDPDKFIVTCKQEFNKWYDDFTITEVGVIDDNAEELCIEIGAFHNVIGAWIFKLPSVRLGKRMLRGEDAMIIWELIHTMLKGAHAHLMEIGKEAK